jgi:hypothetical protein
MLALKIAYQNDYSMMHAPKSIVLHKSIFNCCCTCMLNQKDDIISVSPNYSSLFGNVIGVASRCVTVTNNDISRQSNVQVKNEVSFHGFAPQRCLRV